MGLKAIPDKLYLYIHPTKPIFVFFYINNILIIKHPSCRQQMEDILKQLQNQFKIHQILQFTSFLNTHVVQDQQKGKLWLCLNQYLKKLVSIYHLEYLKPSATPLSGQELTPYKGETTPNQTKGYQRHIGSAIYPASTTRPDITFSVSRLAKFLQNPSPAHLAEINRLLTYLYNTKFLALKYSTITLYEINQVLKAASNTSFADNTLIHQSSQGFLISLFNKPIIWQAIK